MDQVFGLLEDWFQVGIAPAIRRRTIIGGLIIAGCVAGSMYFQSWPPLVLVAIVFAERVFEFAHISKTKQVVGSLTVRVTENSLALGTSDTKEEVVYPWRSLAYRVINSNGGGPAAISIEDCDRKNSKQKLVGYERMNELAALIAANANKP
ncbi:hypothetical protein [Marinobacter arenosus]|uniref:hypothetical protein n=1 Tax=Marinobacter arenosus TaxID=2856822 RepID=UPI001C4C5B9C|nr:hypothetical protein [Marinobacter arenosus]MBW0149546.1 hypothetical protein [Marinobacter arenosus]